MKEYGRLHWRVHRHSHLWSEHKSNGEDSLPSPSFPQKFAFMSEQQAMDRQRAMTRRAVCLQNKMVELRHARLLQARTRRREL